MTSLFGRKNITHSTLPDNIDLRMVPIRQARVQNFLSAWQVAVSIPWYRRAISAQYGRPASTSPGLAHVVALLLRSPDSSSKKTSPRVRSSATYIRSSRPMTVRRAKVDLPGKEALPAVELARRFRRLSFRADAYRLLSGSWLGSPLALPLPPLPPPPPPPPPSSPPTRPFPPLPHHSHLRRKVPRRQTKPHHYHHWQGHHQQLRLCLCLFALGRAYFLAMLVLLC